MEIFWQRKPKISSSSAAQSFNDFTPSTASASFKGNKHPQKQRKIPNDTTEKDQLRFESSRRSSKLSTGTPMKKLLEQEMSKNNESRRRIPSLIARLMRLDVLPPRQPNHKQRKEPESSQVKVQKGGMFPSRRSSKKSLKERHGFKDVFEVLDASKVGIGGYLSKGTSSSKLSDVELAFMHQKYMEVKSRSTDYKLKDSEELSDTLEVLDSNTDILLELLQKPGSLFAKHLDDLHGASPHCRCGRISTMKSSHKLKDRDGCIGQKPGREAQLKNHGKYPRQHQEDILSQSNGRYAAHNRLKGPKVQLEENNGPAIIPTRIAVLKPSLGKSQISTRTASSPCSSHHFPSGGAGNSGSLGIQNEEVQLWGAKSVHQDIGLSRHNSRQSRKIAREITRRMKDSFSNGSLKISTGRFRGYAGDVHSQNVLGFESSNDSGVTTVSYTDNIGWNKQHRRSSSHSSDSTLSREAKKRLSERWKLTQRPQEVDVISTCSTLGEMLAISDREASPANSSSGFAEERCSGLSVHDRPAVWNEHLGISSRDSWKDGCLSSLSNSGSLRINTRHESLRIDKYVIRKDGSKRGIVKAVKDNFNQREAPLRSNQRFHVKKSQCPISSCSSNEENSDTSLDFHFTPYHVKQNSEGDNQSEDSLMVSEASASTAMDLNSVLDNAVDADESSKVVLSEPSHTELSAPDSPNAAVFTGGVDNMDSQEPSGGPSKQATFHFPVSDLESRVIYKEADQPSPVSIIEAPFTDDFSSGSECFESLSADLHGLRLQLQLLKLESEAYEDGIMLLSSDDDGDEVSIGFAEDKGIPRDDERWESMYILDVLVGSEINGVDPDTFIATWYSPECPVNPFIFEELEKKYRNLNPRSRAERRLMFDMINSKLLEIYQQYMDQYLNPSVKSARKLILKWNIEELEDSLRKSLVIQNMELHMDAGETVLVGECQWLDTREDIDEICREMEKLFVDELAAEVMVAG